MSNSDKKKLPLPASPPASEQPEDDQASALVSPRSKEAREKRKERKERREKERKDKEEEEGKKEDASASPLARLVLFNEKKELNLSLDFIEFFKDEARRVPREGTLGQVVRTLVDIAQPGPPFAPSPPIFPSNT